MLKKFFIDQLKDIYYAEQMLTYIAESYINIEAEDEGNYSRKKGEEEDSEVEKSNSLATYSM